MVINPLTLGLVTGGLGAAQSLLGFSSAQQQTAQQNKQIQEQYRQRLRIQAMQDVQRFGQYNLKVASYKDQLVNLNKTFGRGGLQDVQEQLRINQLEKQQRFAAQTENINRTRALGKIAARGQQGASAARMQALEGAQFGRQAAARQERMLGEYYASELRGQARTQQLEAAQKAAYSQVAYAPTRTPAPLAPTMLQGPSAAGLFANLAGNVLSGVTAGFGQANFEKQLASKNPNETSVPNYNFDLLNNAFGG